MTYGTRWDASSQGPIGMPADRPGNFRNLKLASWPYRVAAGLIDYGVIGFIPTACLTGIAAGIGISTQVVIWIPYTLIAINSGLLASYTTQSLGKRLLGIHMVQSVIDPSNPSGAYLRHVAPGTALLRLVCHIIDVFPLPVGFFWPILDKNRATFADKLTKTIHVRDPKMPEPELRMRGKREWQR